MFGRKAGKGMRWVLGNKGNVVVIVIAVITGIVAGLVIGGGFYAEAVIGGGGNVTSTYNPHNFSAGSAGVNAPSMTQVCIFCHTPHHATTATSLINAPLWNHKLSEVANYTYQMGNRVTIALNPPDGSSRMCLSCHDGTVSVGDVYSRTSIIAVQGPGLVYDVSPGGMLTEPSLFVNSGTIGGHHIFSIPMNQSLIDRWFADCGVLPGVTTRLKYPWEAPDAQPTQVFLRPTNQTYDGQPGIDGGSVGLAGYKAGYKYGVQCSTCHDPHLYWKNASNCSCRFLVAGACAAAFCGGSNDSLCLACHKMTCP